MPCKRLVMFHRLPLATSLLRLVTLRTLVEELMEIYDKHKYDEYVAKSEGSYETDSSDDLEIGHYALSNKSSVGLQGEHDTKSVVTTINMCIVM